MQLGLRMLRQLCTNRLVTCSGRTFQCYKDAVTIPRHARLSTAFQMFGNPSPYLQMPIGLLSVVVQTPPPLPRWAWERTGLQQPSCPLRWSLLRCAQEGRQAVLACPPASTSHRWEGGGELSRVATAPTVQGTLVSPCTSVTARTHPGLWFCIHKPEQSVWLRSSQKDWWGRATRGQTRLTSFK